MNEQLTQILVIQDRSGSMGSLRQQTIDGFNEFVKGQRSGPGDCLLRLIQFDHQYDVVVDKPIAEVSDLTNATYVPRGSTALLDAIGRAITDLGNDLKAMSDEKRPGKVVAVIMTDGHENASRDFDRAKVFEMIKHQQETYKWIFLFIGANQDAIQEGAALGIRSFNSLTYAASAAGTRNTYAAMNDSVLRARSAVSCDAAPKVSSFTEQERSSAIEKE